MNSIHLNDTISPSGAVVVEAKESMSTKQALSMLTIVLLLIAACIFISPILVFTVTSLIGIITIFKTILDQISSIEYDLGNNLVDQSDIEEFKYMV